MILIEPLKRAIEIVRMFNGLEREQLAFLLKKEYHNRNPDADINKLLGLKQIFWEDDIIFVPDLKINPDICVAVQVMQVFWSKNVIAFNRGSYPALITYLKITKKGLRRFHICMEENVSDLRICDENAVVVVITDDKALQCPHLENYYLAVDEDGKYNFYDGRKRKK